jgi:hypothetical protein
LDRIRRQLALGCPVELIGQTGPPSWYQVQLGQSNTAIWNDPDQPFTLYSPDLFLVELLRDPPVTAYRFQAEVQHLAHLVDHHPLGVGIYFLHNGPATDPGQHWFGTLSFNDHVNSGLPEGNPVEFEIRHVLGPVGGPWAKWHQAPNPPIAHFALSDLKAWHRLAVEVNQTEVILQWENEPACAIPYADLNKVGGFIQRGQAERNPAVIAPMFGPRTGLGLFVSGGKAAFRHVVVEPLKRE